jgi:hypothetical protein
MKKLTLKLDALQIESFDTSGEQPEERGTVQAHDQCGCSCCCTAPTSPCSPTCDTSPTHPGYQTCDGTCDEWTCNYSDCYGSCYGWSCNGYCGPDIQVP